MARKPMRLEDRENAATAVCLGPGKFLKAVFGLISGNEAKNGNGAGYSPVRTGLDLSYAVEVASR